MATIVTEEDEMTYKGEALPILSASAKKMRIDKLLAAPRPTYSSSVPGSYLWTKIAFWMCRRVSSVQFRSTSTTSTTNLQRDGAGAMCCGWHTNGLMDPLGIFLHHPKEFVVGARHDLVTRPLLGWWTRRLAVQPVVKKRNCYGAVARRRSHPPQRALLARPRRRHCSRVWMRALSRRHQPRQFAHDTLQNRPSPNRSCRCSPCKSQRFPLPQLVPVGLHYRRRELFRTDQYIEFGDPISLDEAAVPQAMVDAVRDGGWVEPPATIVHEIRDQLQASLPSMTPHGLMGRAPGLAYPRPPRCSSERPDAGDVAGRGSCGEKGPRQLAGKNPSFPPQPLGGERLEKASEVAELLDQRGLDGRDLNRSGTGLRRAHPMYAPLGILRTLLFLIRCYRFPHIPWTAGSIRTVAR